MRKYSETKTESLMFSSWPAGTDVKTGIPNRIKLSGEQPHSQLLVCFFKSSPVSWRTASRSSSLNITGIVGPCDQHDTGWTFFRASQHPVQLVLVQHYIYQMDEGHLLSKLPPLRSPLSHVYSHTKPQTPKLPSIFSPSPTLLSHYWPTCNNPPSLHPIPLTADTAEEVGGHCCPLIHRLLLL